MQDTRPIKPEYLHNPSLRLLLFGGKGGVGKTTLSAAAGLSLAIARPDQTILLLSTDPAHSLADSLGMALDNAMTPVPVPGMPPPFNLHARHLSAESLALKFREENGEIMKTIAQRGTYLDDEDIAGFFDLSMPGIDEMMAILEVGALLSRGVCDVLVLDTAPTGHTLRLLALPERMAQWVRVMDLMLHKHRYMATAFTGRTYVGDRCDRFLDTMGRALASVRALLADGHRTRFVPVMVPEVMSFRETEALVAHLEVSKVPLREVVVNGWVPQGACPRCRQARAGQLQVMAEICRRFTAYDLVCVERAPCSVEGMGSLMALAGRVASGGDVCPASEAEAVSTLDGETQWGPAMAPVHGDPEGLFESLAKRVASGLGLVVVGGKGGVGKTTVAATIGVFLARHFKEKRVLLFSTDPAHSLSDALGVAVGDRIVSVAPRLSACEIDAEALFEKFKGGCREEIQALFDQFVGRGMEIAFDREVMTELMEMAPSGLDEIMAFDAMMAIQGEGNHDILVVDASPTGHLLRFLEMPALVRQWLKAYFTVLMKYRGTVSLAATAEKVIALSRNVRKIQAQMVHGEKTAFVGVSLPEPMVHEETKRLMAQVAAAGIPCGHLVINRMMAEGPCPVCGPAWRRQGSCLKEMKASYPDLYLSGTPLFPQGPRGEKALAEFAGSFFRV